MRNQYLISSCAKKVKRSSSLGLIDYEIYKDFNFLDYEVDYLTIKL